MYTIELLSSEEYDQLPYKYAKESLGCADAKTGKAYIRQTGYLPFDMITLQHEVEELATKISPHEEDGIRYKKGKDIFTNIVAPLAVGLITGGLGLPAMAGAAIGATGGAIHGYQENKGAGALTGAITGGLGGYGGATAGANIPTAVEASGKLGGGVVGKTLSGAQAALTGTSGAQKALGTVAEQGFSALPQYATSVGPMTGQSTTGAMPTLNLGGALSDIATQVGGGKGVQQTTPASTTPTTQTAQKGLLGGTGEAVSNTAKTIGGITGQQALGGLLTGASALPKTPSNPGYASVTEKYIGQPITEMGQLATTNINEILSTPAEQLFPIQSDEYFLRADQAIEEAYAEAEQNMNNRYSDFGALNSSDFNREFQKLQSSKANERAALRAESYERRFEAAKQQKWEAVKTALALDDQQMQYLMNAELQDAAAAFNARVEDIQSIRDALGTVGGTLMKQDQNVLGQLAGTAQ